MKIYGHASLQRELWTEDEWEIFEEFHFKCIRCLEPAIVLHEDEPKSLRPKTWREKENRSPLCKDCHSWAHYRGTKISRPILKVLKKLRLQEYANPT